MDDRAVNPRFIHWLYRALAKNQFPLDIDGCWTWVGCVTQKNYPQISLDGKAVYVARLAWKAAYGHIPEGMHLHHRCFTRRCVRLDHLQLVTAAEHDAIHAALRKAAA